MLEFIVIFKLILKGKVVDHAIKEVWVDVLII